MIKQTLDKKTGECEARANKKKRGECEARAEKKEEAKRARSAS